MPVSIEAVVAIFCCLGLASLIWFVYSVMNDDDIGPASPYTMMFFGN
jgi:hypothetical protein